MFKFSGFIVTSFLLVALCSPVHADQDNKILAKVGDRKMIEQNPQLRDSILRQVVQSMVLADLAKKAGYDKRPEVVEQMDLFKENFLANEYLKKEIVGKMSVPEADMKAYYDAHEEEFQIPEMVRASHILVKVDQNASEEDKKKAKEKAEDILKRIRAGEDFAKLASEMSDDTMTKTKGGDLGFFPKGRMIKPFEDAAFDLKAGEVSGIVESPFGYHIIKVEERKEAALEPYDAAKDQIKQKILQDRVKTEVSAFMDKALKDAGAEIYSEQPAESSEK